VLKVTCPKCKKVLQAPDDWAGKKVKCTGCKHPVRLPAAEQQDASSNDLSFDLGTLGALESAGRVTVREAKGKPMTLKEAQEAAKASQTIVQPDDPTIRICPSCRLKVKVADPHTEVMCRHCGAGIPPVAILKGEKARYQDSMADRMKIPVTFYSGFTQATTYPLPALGAIAGAMGIALLSIALPLLVILGFLASSSLNPINETKEGTDYGWVGVFISVAFIAQAVYFGSVGYYILIDTIRTTTSGAEHPPNLTWNVINLGAALGGYVALLLLYALVMVVLVTISKGFPDRMADFAELSRPGNIAVLALITFGVPMNMIGLSSSHALEGLNPLSVGKSIFSTLGHYIFLFLITMLYLGIYIGIMAAVLNWAGPMILRAAKEGLGAGFLNMLLGLVAWAVVMGAGFYFAYAMGRILGLFCRTYREQLAFEL